MKQKFSFIAFVMLLMTQFAISQRTMVPEDLWKLGRVSDPQVSPDGKEVLYNIRTYDLAANKGNSDIWKVAIASSSAVKIAGEVSNESSAKWSKDGKKIFYLNDQGGASTLCSMNPDGTGKVNEVKLENDINAYGISGDGNMVWLAMDVKVTKTAKDIYPDLPKSTGRLYDDLMYRHWDRWDDGTYSHIFIAGFSNGKLTSTPLDIMSGEAFDSPMKPMDGEEQISWRPDGKVLAYTCKKLSGREYALTTNSDIYLYDVENKTTANLTEGMPGYDKNPVFSPDGKMLLWMSQKDAGNEADRQRIFLKDFTANAQRELTAGYDNNVNQTVWGSAGDKFYFTSGVNATEQVFVYDLKLRSALPLKQITNDEADHTSISVANDGKSDVVVSACMSISQPTEIFSIDLKSGKSKQITFTNKEVLAGIKMGRVEKRWVKATDGKNILTWVIFPPDYVQSDKPKKYPTLLYCQGGPQSTVSQFFSYRWNFQLMAAMGYVVVAPNRRGLPSFGEKWNDDISGDWGGQCMQDLLSAIDSVSQEPFVDKNKLGAVGASFGGFSVFWLEGNHNNRFKTFISHDGVFNLESMYGATEETFFNNYEFGGPYWNSPKPVSYSKFSPHLFVEKWNTPILIITNEKDYRVPLEQGLEAYTAARVKNIPARLLTFPDENHWVLKPQNSVLWQRVFFDWLDRYLK